MSGDRPGFVDGRIVDGTAFSESIESDELERLAKGRSTARAEGTQWAEVIEELGVIEPGAPIPHILADDTRAVLLYFAQSRGPVSWIVFDRVRYVSLGYPNEEALEGHPLYDAGLRHFRAHEVFDSGLASLLEKRNRVHAHHRADYFLDARHMVITFHDRTFDCLCEGWTTGTFDGEFRQALELGLTALREGQFPEPSTP